MKLLHRFRHFSLVVFFVLASCGSAQKDLPIPLQTMTDIITEIHLGQGYFERIGVQNPRWQDSIPYNRYIVERHGYTWADFDSTLTLVCFDQRLLDKIYERVFLNLNHLLLEQAQIIVPDTLWRVTDVVYPFYRERGPYELYALTRGAGTYTFYANIRVHPQDQMPAPRLTGFWEMQDTTGEQMILPFTSHHIRKFGTHIEYRAQKTFGPEEYEAYSYGGLKMTVFDIPAEALADTTWSQYAEIKQLYVLFEPLPE